MTSSADPTHLLLGQTMRSVGFLSCIPVAQRWYANAQSAEMRNDSRAFPLAGVLIAAGPAILLVLLDAIGLPATMAAAFTVLGMIAITGALHEDGLGDVADGFGGGDGKETRLQIMKDSRIGTYGAVAIAGSILLRVAGVSAIATAHGGFAAGVAVIAVAACSRAGIVWLWASMPNARGDGVAHGAGTPTDSAVSTAAITGLGLFALLATATIGFVNAAVALLLALGAMQGFGRLTRRMIGGVTGDTLGAGQQIVEIALLTGLALGVSIPM